MTQNQCECQSGTNGHEPGECKNAMTHEEDRMCDYCHDKAADLLAGTVAALQLAAIKATEAPTAKPLVRRCAVGEPTRGLPP